MENTNQIPACRDINRAAYSLSPRRSIIDAEEIFWHVVDYDTDIDDAAQLRAFERAYGYWKPILAPILITPTKDISKAHHTLHFASDNDPNDRPPDPFGAKSTLAQAYFPVNNKSSIWFDKDEDWSEVGTANALSLTAVAVHEIGHALGISHTNFIADIMYPSYQGHSVNLTEDSEAAIEELYGHIKKRIRDREDPTEDLDLVKQALRVVFPNYYGLYRLHTTRQNQLADILGVTLVGRRKLNRTRQLFQEIQE